MFKATVVRVFLSALVFEPYTARDDEICTAFLENGSHSVMYPLSSFPFVLCFQLPSPSSASTSGTFYPTQLDPGMSSKFSYLKALLNCDATQLFLNFHLLNFLIQVSHVCGIDGPGQAEAPLRRQRVLLSEAALRGTSATTGRKYKYVYFKLITKPIQCTKNYL